MRIPQPPAGGGRLRLRVPPGSRMGAMLLDPLLPRVVSGRREGAMPTYRAYLINEDNRVASYKPIDADADAEALTAARPLADGCDAEVWRLDRKIGRLERQAPMRSTKRWKTLAWEASFFRDVSSRPRRAPRPGPEGPSLRRARGSIARHRFTLGQRFQPVLVEVDRQAEPAIGRVGATRQLRCRYIVPWLRHRFVGCVLPV